ncbi:glycosyltransferase family 4 protein [Georgenia wutianyii]|uniref:Glycosyltransferase family 4 protein n=1 Tax=Georgenia wutianyii TaxID=2585135 RepID=A0ABX5VJK3_9MICO|nr:glycosyltransferase family 4 protein [Georgenia wutianyii]QDB78586.1 glycosyltransferase family 4 protein [Georgenia wutianyii]
MPGLRFVVPARGAAGPSGGDVYDARLARAWDGVHGHSHVLALPGGWPRPGPAERRALGLALRTPDTVVLDGLVGSACPREVERAVDGGTRVVLLVHLPLPAEAGLPAEEAARLAELEAAAVRAASDVVATSTWAARDLERRYGRRDVLVAVPGAEQAPLAEGSRPPHLLALGALTAVKNQTVLVPALAALRDLPWEATFAGPAGAQPDVARDLVRALADAGLSDRVALPGAVVGDGLADLWRRTDLLLLPSLVETYGLVVTEALAHGLPALIPAGTGAVEALTGAAGETCGPDAPGTAVDPTDPAAWERVLRRWLTSAPLREGWRAAAHARRARLRTWADTAADLRRGLFG